MTLPPEHLLIVEDDAGLAELLEDAVRRLGFRCDVVRSARACEAWLASHATDLAVLDYSLPDKPATALVESLRAADRLPSFLVITGHGDEQLAVRLMREGALDYLVKDAQVLERLPGTLVRAVGEAGTRRRLAAAKGALRASEARYRRLFEDASEGIALADAETGRLVDCNRAFLQLFGYEREEVIGRPQAMLHPGWDGSQALTRAFQVHRGVGAGTVMEVPIIDKHGVVRQAEVKADLVELEGRRLLQGFFRDVTETWRFRHERATSLRLLKLLNQDGGMHELIAGVTAMLQELTGFEAVGMRLRQGEVFPYFETRGLPEAFVRRESSLCSQDAAGGVVREPGTGLPVLECLCGAVLRSQLDPGLPCCTPKGNFWTNHASELFAERQAANPPTPIRGRCPQEGYESMALLALRHGTETLGLLQLNDRSKGRLTLELVSFLEGMADQVAVALAQRHARSALQAQEERYRTLVDNAVEAIVVVQDGRLKFVNPQAGLLFGCATDELAGRSFLECIHPADRSLATENYRETVLSAGRPQDYDARILRKDGRVRALHVRTTRLAWEGAVAILAFLTDITADRRRKEMMAARLRLLELAGSGSLAGLLQSTLDEAELLTGSTVGFYHFLEPDRGSISLQAWSTNTARLMGRAEGVGPRAPVDPAAVWAECIRERRAVVHNDCAALPHPLGLPLGTAPLVRALVVPVFRGEAITAILGVGNKPADYDDEDIEMMTSLADLAWDIAERKRKEEALEQSERRFRDITMTMADWVWEVDVDGRYTFVSGSVEQILGYKAGEVVGRTPFELMPPGEADRMRDVFQAAVERREPFTELAQTMLHRDGTARQLLVSGVPILGTDGALLGYRGCDRDVTEHRRLEKQFLRAQRLESLGALASGVAHDLNNVLSPILMSAGLLRDVVTDPEDRQIVEMLHASAHRGAAIVTQLLSFARGSEARYAPLRTRHVLREVAKIVEETFPKRIQLALRQAEGIWDVVGDSTQIHQILLNLCVNARDAMPDGGTLTVTGENLALDAVYVSMNPEARAGRFVRLAVRDTGMGISSQDLEKIFDPFFTTKPAGEGTGLGLATVLRIVKAHQGFVEVESHPGAGSEFRIYLPASVMDADPAAPAPAAASHIEGRGECILVVDDEEPVRRVTVGALERHGFRTLAAGDGAEALMLYVQHRDEVRGVVLDMMMPMLDGPSTIRAMRRVHPALPILAVSGMADQEEELRRLKDDHLHFLGKPFTTERLLQALSLLLSTQAPPTSTPS